MSAQASLGNLVTEKGFPWGVRCRECRMEILIGEAYCNRPYSQTVLPFTSDGAGARLEEIICTACAGHAELEEQEAA